ncbi:hypothetical protein MMC09_002089 [Bachmanniomyces sp. S44760]|nr:hypothetical protein [Bachmanniomyces sp. S44760]
MARGNQRDKAREKNLKESSGMVNMDEEISNLFLAYLMETCPAEEKKQPERYRVRAHQGAAGSYHEAEARRRKRKEGNRRPSKDQMMLIYLDRLVNDE